MNLSKVLWIKRFDKLVLHFRDDSTKKFPTENGDMSVSVDSEEVLAVGGEAGLQYTSPSLALYHV